MFGLRLGKSFIAVGTLYMYGEGSCIHCTCTCMYVKIAIPVYVVCRLVTVNVAFLIQGRKKKRFIDKRNAQTFRLVSRSQSDPLYGQLEESQNVLKPNQVSSMHFLPAGRAQCARLVL